MEISLYFYTQKQAASLLGVNRLTIWRWINNGKFNIQHVGREVLIAKWEVDLIKQSEGGK